MNVDDFSPDDREFYEERAAIREYVANEERADAEREAFKETMKRILQRG